MTDYVKGEMWYCRYFARQLMACFTTPSLPDLKDYNAFHNGVNDTEKSFRKIPINDFTYEWCSYWLEH